MRTLLTLLLILCLMVSAPAVMAEEPKKEKTAVSAAIKWLGMVDDGNYAENWKAAAVYPYYSA